mmetsp:Transcript_3782/g.5577  ORF Transcript_3782/g.5577 Transcript_3782/m.5577 type:complete len:106 (-) Transcript_3782:1654-1971(-)
MVVGSASGLDFTRREMVGGFFCRAVNEKDLETRRWSLETRPNKLCHSLADTKDSWRAADTIIRQDTAAKAAGKDTKLVDITPSETAILTIILGIVISEQRASDGI